MPRTAFRKILPVVAFASLMLASGAISPSPYTSMVVFGDSLSDSGNDAIALGGSQKQTITGNTYIPSAPYSPGTTFSNGPVWASQVAAALNLPLSPSQAGGTNFAFGGAT